MESPESKARWHELLVSLGIGPTLKEPSAPHLDWGGGKPQTGSSDFCWQPRGSFSGSLTGEGAEAANCTQVGTGGRADPRHSSSIETLSR
ncbi:hypothetical protein CesoFtcFv8_015259 [Champsocephalus esox]|uniref:Uncharacterized protein n=1 Tax=Champsocephalus esox TaxID=159716 RepID=A0AAN8GSR1_9TELE|nr:hypothetical protein CesoFtcFv8_015259 [Champsocephalus esox]